MLKRAVIYPLLTISLAVFAGGILIGTTDTLGWRAVLVRAKIAGGLPEIPTKDLVRWMLPGSEMYVGSLAQTLNVHSGISNPNKVGQYSKQGEALYASRCSGCHGADARGANGPDLISATDSGSDWSFFSSVRYGVEGSAMQPQSIPEREIWNVLTYISSLKSETMALAGDRNRTHPSAPVTSQDLQPESLRLGEWLTFAGNYSGHRHSQLQSLNLRNIDQIELAWARQINSTSSVLQSTPLVANGLMYVTVTPAGLVALDAKSGQPAWDVRPTLKSGLSLCCGTVNRGAALWKDSVYFTTADARLFSINASNGRINWQISVADPAQGYSLTGAPLAVNGRIVIGTSGGDFGAPGFIAAYDADDGATIWKFNTVPIGEEFGHDTWANDSRKTGGASPWSTGAYDPEHNLIYWGVGNPSPAYNDKSRQGDNLFSNSVVVLDADSGARKWHFQFTPGGVHDWDSVQQPILTNLNIDGIRVPTLLWGNRNGFFYRIDRRTGKFISAHAFVKQNWASGFDANGRPIVRDEARPSKSGALVFPSLEGATNWWPPSYDQNRETMFLPILEGASIYYSDKAVKEKGAMFVGGAAVPALGETRTVSIAAIDATTGLKKWKTALGTGADSQRGIGGVMSTSTGLVFAGHNESLVSLDSDSGEIVWRVNLGGVIRASPITYELDGKQYVAIIAGRVLYAFSVRPNK